MAQRSATSPDAALAHAAALKDAGRLRAAAAIAAQAAAGLGDADAIVRVAHFLRACQAPAVALDVCTAAVARGVPPLLIRAFAGQLALALGRFDEARSYLLAALRGGVDLNACFPCQDLADCQRYEDPQHPDFAAFEALLGRADLSAMARASILFALGKACDDVGDVASAARHFRAGNALAQAVRPWSRPRWREWISMLKSWPELAESPEPAPFTMIFVVGMPRSGTTLVAEMLARHPDVRNRGELVLIPALRGRLGPGPGQDAATIAAARRYYEQMVRQDDEPARWYVDKNPLNFRYLDVMRALAPGARVIWCRRGERDTALSIWKQFFAEPDTGFAHDFEAIRDLMDSEQEMMARWQARSTLPVFELHYEDLVARCEEVLPALAQFVRLPEAEPGAAPAHGGAIETASRWQARQPIHRGSVDAWRRYAPYVPELEQRFQ